MLPELLEAVLLEQARAEAAPGQQELPELEPMAGVAQEASLGLLEPQEPMPEPEPRGLMQAALEARQGPTRGLQELEEPTQEARGPAGPLEHPGRQELPEREASPRYASRARQSAAAKT